MASIGDYIGSFVFGPSGYGKIKRNSAQKEFLDYLDKMGGPSATVPMQAQETLPSTRVGIPESSGFQGVPSFTVPERSVTTTRQTPIAETPEFQRRAMSMMEPSALAESLLKEKKPSYHTIKGNRNIYTFEDGRMTGTTQMEEPFQTSKAPVVRDFTEGNRTVPKQWNPKTLSWDEIPGSGGPRWNPEGKESAPKTILKSIDESGISTPGALHIWGYDEDTGDFSQYMGPRIGRDVTGATLNAATTLRKEFQGLPEVEDFKTTRTQFQKLDRAWKEFIASGRTNYSALDQALVIVYNKMLDPTSVVRESEFARTPEGIAFINRIQAKVEKLTRGGVGLTNTDREELVRMAGELFKVNAEIYNERVGDYSDLAGKYGLETGLVIPKGMEKYDIGTIGAKDLPRPGDVEDGYRYIGPSDGDRSDPNNWRKVQ